MRDPANISRQPTLGLDTDRVHHDWQAWLAAEQQRETSQQRLDAVAVNSIICMPNKPVQSCRQALTCSAKSPGNFRSRRRTIARVMHETGRALVLAHTYAGYPMVQEAKQLVAQGALGDLRRIV